MSCRITVHVHACITAIKSCTVLIHVHVSACIDLSFLTLQTAGTAGTAPVMGPRVRQSTVNDVA